MRHDDSFAVARCVLLSFFCASAVACVVPERTFDQDEADRHDAIDADDSMDDATDDDTPGGAGGAGPGSADALCEEYCETVMASCTGEFAVYASVDSCLAVCAMLPQQDDGNNTVECRLEQAILADGTGEPDEHCPPAGPGGSTARGRALCGSNCESYCLLQPQACGGTEELVLEQAECERRCAALPDALSFDVTVHHDADNVQCRLVHVSSAALGETAALTHCWHSAILPDRDSPCGLPAGSAPECEHYCGVVMTACTDELAVYDDAEQCMVACEQFEPGVAGDVTSGNTIECRLRMAYAALGAPDTQCAFAGPTGDGECGSGNCESYCNLASGLCGAAFDAEFESIDACLGICADEAGAEAGSGYRAAGAPDEPGVACRVHAVLSSGGASAACEAALGPGNCEE